MFAALKPYSAYRQSGVPWAPRLPSHWEVRRGKTLFRRLQRSVRPEDGVVTCFRDGQVTLRSRRRTAGFTEALQEIGYQGVRRGDLVIHAMDAFAGAVGVSESDGKSSPVYAVCVPIGGDLPEFGALLVREMARTNWIAALAKGVRERSTDFRFESFAQQELPRPPHPEQAAIVKYLAHSNRRIDQAIAAKRKLIRLLEEQKQVIINQAVTRGLDRNVPMKESGVNGLGPTPAHWQITAAGRLVSLVTSGSRGWAQYYSDEGAIFLQSGNIGRDMSLNLSRVQRVSVHPDAEGSRTRVRSGDVLVCITGALTGNVGLVEVDLDAPAYVNQHVALIRPRSELVLPRYLATALRSSQGQSQFKTEEYGGTKQGLSLADVKGVKISLPPIEEQLRLMAHIEADAASLDATVQRSHREIELLREFRIRLTADVVTGHVDVRAIATTLPDVELDELVDGSDEAADDALDDEMFEDLEEA